MRHAKEKPFHGRKKTKSCALSLLDWNQTLIGASLALRAVQAPNWPHNTLKNNVENSTFSSFLRKNLVFLDAKLLPIPDKQLYLYFCENFLAFYGRG